MAVSPTGSPPLPFLPYIVDPSQFPAPDTILSTLGNISNPQLTTVSDHNQTFFELVYTQSSPDGSNLSVMYTAGRYDPTWAVCILDPTNSSCAGAPAHPSPINWSTPVTLVQHFFEASGHSLQVAIGGSGGTVAVAVSSDNKTNVSLAGDFGLNVGWSSITPQPIPGGSPKLAVSPCNILLTTVKWNAITATTFDLPCSLPQTPAQPGGGEGPIGPLGPGGQPQVTQVTPNTGNAGTPVEITGSNFAPGATVDFESVVAWTVQYVSPTEITAVAPAGFNFTNATNVTVTVSGLTSPTVPADIFTYQPPVPPAVKVVVPATALPGTFVNVTGANFDVGSGVLFGGRGALQTRFISSTDLMAQVPWGVGQVDVQVVDSQMSTINPGDVFTFALQATTLAASVSASPVLASDPGAPSGTAEGIVATQDTNSSTVFLRSTNGGASYTSFLVGTFSKSTGSPILSSLGSTRVFLGGGIPAQTAALSIGSLIFSLYTSQLENRTVVKTAASVNGGVSWTGPYPAAPLMGTLADPELAVAPDGYVYATWLENAIGTWQLDQAVFAESGQLLYGPTPIPGTASGSPSLLASPSVAVDGLARPIYLWSAINSSTNMTEIRFTGAFPSAANVVTDLSAAFQQTTSEPWEFAVQGDPQTDFQSDVEVNISLLQSLLGTQDLCTIQSQVVATLGPELTTNVPIPIAPGAPGYCNVAVPAASTEIVNATGPGAADTYLGVYLDWLIEAVGYAKVKEPYWPGAPGNPDANDTLPFNPGSPQYAPDEFNSTTGQFYTFAVDPVTVNPNTLWLNVSGVAFGSHKYVNETSCARYGEGSGSIVFTDDSNATAQWATVTVNQTSVGPQTYLLHGFWKSSFLTDLQPGSEGVWSMTVHTNYTETQTVTSSCSEDNGTSTSVIGFTSGMPQSFSATLSGYFTTVEETVPAGLVVHEVGNKTHGGDAYDYIAWNNSVVGWANATVRGPSYATFYNNFANQTAENTGQFAIPLSNAYTAWANITSEDGGANSAWLNQFDTGFNGGVSSPAEVGGSYCSFVESANPIKLAWQNSKRIQNVTTSSATLTWFSNVPGRGWASYNATTDGVYTQTALMVNESTSPVLANYPYQYQVQLSGLSPWNIYHVTVGVSTYSGCLEFDNGDVWNVQVTSLVQPQEMDLPYDSITLQGGGARVTWTVPSEFASAASFDNGSLTYCQWNSTACMTNTTVIVPLTGLSTLDGGSQFVFYWINDTFQVNLTGLASSATYNVTILLNYTYKGAAFVAESDPYYFQYEWDSSGDGLTDWEKLRGWEVTAQTPSGEWYTENVTANPLLYATNGLTSDYVEKLYGLNPRTVDTANSHMLDTWNLTFDLGPKSSPAVIPSGSDFRYWYEAGNSSTDYTWTDACQYYVGPGSGSCGKGEVGSGWSNISGNDSWAWASRVLWSRAALDTFVNLSGVQAASWLRATLGNTTSNWTLTIWGKLSWGANPLAASTPTDGVADGARVNPLYDEQLVIGNLWSNLTTCPSPPSGGAYGWAALFYLNWSTTSGPHELPAAGNYSVAALDDGSGSYGCGSGISGYRVAIPFNGTSQNQSLQIRLILNESSKPTQTVLKAGEFVNGSGTVASVAYDAAAGQDLRYSFSGSNGNLAFSLSLVPSGVKTNTLLWLPTDNGTLNNLPWGLKRFTGEQAFDLIVVNQTTSSTILSDYVPYAQNSSDSYQLNLDPGLNNILIPRGQFLYSVLGQAIMLDSNTSWLNSSALPPLLGSDENSTIDFGSPNPMMNLGCYWQNRVINNTTGSLAPICMHNSTNGLTNETGTPLGSSSGIVVVTDTAASGIDKGGVPTNPTLENASDEGAALQAVLTLNISTQTGFDLLLSALLDNTTGGVNGTLLPVTYQVPSLGLNSVVTRELANSTQASSGLFGVPWGKVPPPPPPPPCSSLWCYASNLVSGVVLVGGQLFSYVWTAAVAVAQFVNDHLPSWLKQLGGELLARTVAAIVAAGSILAEAFTALINDVIIPAVEGLLTAITTPLEQIASSYYSTLNSTMSGGDANAFANALSGNFFSFALGLGTAAEIALAMLTPVSLGTGFLVSIVVSMLITATLVLASTAGLTSAFGSVTAFGSQMVRDLQGWVNGTSASPDVKLPTRYNQLAGMFALLAAATALPFSIALLAKDLGYAGGGGVPRPEIPILAFALAIVTLVLHFVFAVGHVPLYLLILGAIVGGLAVVLGISTIRTRAPGPWKTMGAIDLGVTAISFGVTVYELLSEG